MESLQPREPICIHWLAASGCWKCGVNISYRRTVESVQRRGRENRSHPGIVVILQSGGRRYALLVDQLLVNTRLWLKTLKVTIAKSPDFCCDHSWRRQRGTDC